MSDEAVSDVVDGANEQPNEVTPTATGEGAASEQKDAMIPKARLDAEIAKRKELQAAAEELQALKRAQADAEAEKAGAIEKFKAERDELAAQVKAWESSATTKLEELMEQLDDVGKGVLSDLEDAPLAKRLSIAEKLAAQVKKEEPSGFGSSGGKSGGQRAGLIPPEARTSRAAYDQWLADITNSGDVEAMSILVDGNKRRQLEEEARKLFG